MYVFAASVLLWLVFAAWKVLVLLHPTPPPSQGRPRQHKEAMMVKVVLPKHIRDDAVLCNDFSIKASHSTVYLYV